MGCGTSKSNGPSSTILVSSTNPPPLRSSTTAPTNGGTIIVDAICVHPVDLTSGSTGVEAVESARPVHDAIRSNNNPVVTDNRQANPNFSNAMPNNHTYTTSNQPNTHQSTAPVIATTSATTTLPEITSATLIDHHRVAICFPSESHFGVSTNGRNGWSNADVYEIGDSPEDVLGKGTFGHVFRARHRFANQANEEFKENDNEDDDEDDIVDPDVLYKRQMLGLGPRSSQSKKPTKSRSRMNSSGSADDSSQHSSSELKKSAKHHKKKRPFDNDWKEYVAIKTTRPTELDTLRGTRAILTYDDAEKHCAEIRMLIKLRGNSARQSHCLFLYEYFMSSTNSNGSASPTAELHLVTEILGQELDKWRASRPNFLERDAMKAAKSILQGIEFMHSKSVVHRDIKLENILFRYGSSDPSTLKIVDFGLARTLEGNEKARDFCGSYGYIAPEIYERRSYKFEVDMFAFGVVLFRLLSGERPFPSNNQEVLQRKTVNLQYNVQGRDWQTVSSQAKDLIRRLLINRRERWMATECLDHKWFQQQGNSVLRVDLTHLGEDSESHSRAFVMDQSYMSTSESRMTSSSNRFWIDAILIDALGQLQSMGIYHGVVVDVATQASDDGESNGMVCVEESVPDDFVPLPIYIGRRKSYNEMDCRFICKKIAEAIKLMHSNGMAHRNLHIENVLLDTWGNLSIKGFQFVQPIEDGRPLTGHFGYFYSWFAFKAPEVDTAFVHDQSVDLWSLGSLIYMLLTGLPPFRGTGEALVESKRRGHISFDIVRPSDYAQSLVRALLQVKPENRLTIDEVLEHEWMTADDTFLGHFDLSLSLHMMHDWNQG